MKRSADDRPVPAIVCPEGCPGERDRRAGWAPCRAADERRKLSGDLIPMDPGLEGNLADGSIDLGKFLAETGRVAFKASGTCMYPSLRPGDILHIAPRGAGDVQVGEIAVVRRERRFFGHRAVGKGEDAGGPFIVTRPDRSPCGSDEPVHDPDVLGVVTDIERGGKFHKAPRASASRLAKIAAAPSLALVALTQTARESAGEAALSLQELGLYRRLAAAFFAATKGRYVISVRMPLRPHLDMVLSRVVKGDAVDTLDLRGGEGPPDSFTISIEEQGRPAGSLSFFRRHDGCPNKGWWLSGAKVRVRYRGMGLARILFAKAGEILERSGEPPIGIELRSELPERGWLRRELGLPGRHAGMR